MASSRSGAFMGEGAWQSQPTEATKCTLERPKLPLSGTRDTSLAHERSRPKTAIPPQRRQTLRKRARNRRPAGPARPRDRARTGRSILYGWHTVAAALANPQRQIRKLFLTENAARRLADDNIDTRVPPEIVRPSADRPAARPRRRASGPAGGGRSAALAGHRYARPGRHRAGARPDHRSAQCRRHPALGGGVCGQGHRHHGAAQPGGDRRAGEIGFRRARDGAAGHRAKSRPRAERAERPWLHDGRPRQRGQRRISARSPCGNRWRWCSAPKARACGN